MNPDDCRCTSCGAFLSDDAVACGRCGYLTRPPRTCSSGRAIDPIVPLDRRCAVPLRQVVDPETGNRVDLCPSCDALDTWPQAEQRGLVP